MTSRVQRSRSHVRNAAPDAPWWRVTTTGGRMSKQHKGTEALTRLDVAYDQALTGSLQLGGHTLSNPGDVGTEDDQAIMDEVLQGLKHILVAHGWHDVTPLDSHWVPRHLDCLWGVLMYQTVGNAQDTALQYAQDVLWHNPYDGGIARIEFEQVGDGSWTGERRASTEEGYSNVAVNVFRNTDEVTHDVYYAVDVSTDSRDCDSRYTGGHTVTFRAGEVPVQESDATRDHTAEAAGY